MRPSLRPCVVTHGGAANDPAHQDACEAACEAARRLLERAGDAGGNVALAAAVAAVVVLEDDPRLNAGTGSTLRLDGRIQLDASVMDARGFGAVAALEDTQNPVLVARAVYDLPHRLIVGDGATALARRLGLPTSSPPTEGQRQKHATRMTGLGEHPMWQPLRDRGIDEKFWQQAAELGGACDTVGAVVRDAAGNYAAAASTGGIWCALRGRVGDVPIPGAGLFVGARGAVACTGIGELIWQEMLAVRVHDRLGGCDGGSGRGVQAVVDDVIQGLRERHPAKDVGVIALDDVGAGAAVTGAMPWAMWTGP